jgi:hypothetical protein
LVLLATLEPSTGESFPLESFWTGILIESSDSIQSPKIGEKIKKCRLQKGRKSRRQTTEGRKDVRKAYVIVKDFLFQWGKDNNNGESALWEAENTKKLQSHPKTKPRPTVRRGLHYSLHIGLAFKTRPLLAKSVHIMILGNCAIRT